MSKKTKILVLGSKKESRLPDIEPDIIVAANGAISKALHYKKYQNCLKVAIVSKKQLKKKEIYNRVLMVMPQEIILWRDDINVEDLFYDKISNQKITEISDKFHYNLQKKYFGNIRLFFSHFTIKHTKAYKSNQKGLKLFYNIIIENIKLLSISRGGGGCSTGLFSIIYSLDRWPNSEIIVSGVSMDGGKHHYKGPNFSSKVALRDKRLFPYLDSGIKKRIFTVDENVNIQAGIKLWKYNYIEDI